MTEQAEINAFEAHRVKNPYGFAVVNVKLDENGNPIDIIYKHVNEQLEKLDGKSKEELVGHGYYEVFPNADKKWLDIYYRAAYLGESVFVDDVAEEIGHFLHVQAYPTGETGYCACILCDFRESVDEMIKQKEEKETLEEHAKRADTIKALAAIYSTIVEGDLTTLNYKIVKYPEMMAPLFSKMLEGNFKDIMEPLIENFICEEQREDMREFLKPDTVADRMKNKNTLVTEYKTPHGKYLEGRFVIQNRDEEGNALSVLFVARDITTEKEKELSYLEQLKAAAVEADKANISKTNFLRRMSHDIRTPLNGIIGMLRIMDRNKGNKEKYEECMDKILRSTDYLMTIVNNVLDVSKMESGEIELEHKPFDLLQLLLNTIPIIATNASQNSIIFTGSIDDIHLKHRYVIGSPVHLNRVLMNIASNAIKYNRTGGSLRIYGNELRSDGEQASYEFVCIDTGLGMSEEFQKKAFEPFTREGKQTMTSFSGSGLGLSIVKEIVNKMGGTIELNSKENVGTTVRIVLTLTIDKNHEESVTEDDIPETLDLTGHRALLVEDNEINMEIARIMLEEMGLEITGAKNGQEAIDIFDKSEPYTFDLVFMDMMMPVMDGIEATKTIRAMERVDAANIPIIAMTANAFAEDKQACLDAGMNDHIGKPVDTKEVIRVVSRFIK